MLGWHAYVLTAVALFLWMLVVILVQGLIRVRNNAYVHPEDAAFFGKGASPVAEEAPPVRRAHNVLRNDGENVPVFLLYEREKMMAQSLGKPANRWVERLFATIDLQDAEGFASFLAEDDRAQRRMRPCDEEAR